ncbi:MAG: hypothetical protein PHQ23_10840 [Candidatus Wallbacteria bacterium]|nr:hypothetical protein [Candidatus Wallbacteria bacterium]
MLVYIFRAPRPKGLVRWTKVSFDYASATAADKFDGQTVYYTKLAGPGTNGFIGGPNTELACLFPLIRGLGHSGYFMPDDEYLSIDPTPWYSMDPLLKWNDSVECDADYAPGRCVPPDNCCTIHRHPLHKIASVTHDTTENSVSVPDTDGKELNPLDPKPKPPVRFWVAAFDSPEMAYELINDSAMIWNASRWVPADLTGYNAWEADLSSQNVFGRYLVLKICLYTNSNTTPNTGSYGAGKHPNPSHTVFVDVYPQPVPHHADHEIPVAQRKNYGTMTPRLKGMILEYVEYNPVIRLKKIAPTVGHKLNRANDGSRYTDWQPQIWGSGTREVWNYSVEGWENGTATSELYVRHD